MAKITYINENNQSIELGSIPPYILTSKEGFSSVESIINTVKSPYQDGNTITNQTLASREIVLEGEFFNHGGQSVRRHMIEVFNPKLSGILRYEEEGIVRLLYCRPRATPYIVSTNLATTPYIVELYAANPYWQSVREEKVEGAAVVNMLEFPLEILESGIEFGYEQSGSILRINNNGDVSTGMKIEFKAVGNVSNPSLLNIATREHMTVNRDMVNGDIIMVDTNFQSKTIKRERGGVTTNIFGSIDTDSTFLEMKAGLNTFKFDAADGLSNLGVTVYFTPQYVGV